MAKKKPKKSAPIKSKKKGGAKKLDLQMIVIICLGAILSIFLSPKIAKNFPTLSKYTAPLLAAVGTYIAWTSKARSTKQNAGLGLAVGSTILGVQTYMGNKVMNGPSLYNNRQMLINGPSKRMILNGPSMQQSFRPKVSSAMGGVPSM